MKRIDCIAFSSQGQFSKYDVQDVFLKGLHQGLLASGLESRIVKGDICYPGAVSDALIRDRPECTLMFNGIPMNDQLDSISNDLQIPNISLLIDAPFYFLHVMDQPYIIFTCFDRTGTELYKKMGFQKMLFFPHATHTQEPVDHRTKRFYQAVMFTTGIDPEMERRKWKEKLSPSLCKLMDAAAEAVLHGHVPLTPLAFIELLDSSKQVINLGGIPLKDIFHAIETYVRGRDRLDLIRSIKDTRVDLFGNGWGGLIKQDNVVEHGPVGFDEALAIMRESRVVLNSCPTIRDGSHERVLAGLMGGASVLSSQSRYLEEQFPKGSGVRFYLPGDYASVDSVLAEMLLDEEIRLQEALAGRALVEKGHTWEVRARQLREEAGPIVDAMNRGEIQF